MQLLLILSFLIFGNAHSLQDPAVIRAEDRIAEIFSSVNENDGSGNYYFRFGTSNDQTRKETGKFIEDEDGQNHFIVTGSYSYIDDANQMIYVEYIADENGFRIIPQRGVEMTTTGTKRIGLENSAVFASLLG